MKHLTATTLKPSTSSARLVRLTAINIAITGTCITVACLRLSETRNASETLLLRRHQAQEHQIPMTLIRWLMAHRSRR